MDVTCAGALLVALAPLMLALAALVRLDSPGPAIFRQRRLGRGLEPFTAHKFRTMHDGVSAEAHRRFVASLISGELPSRTDVTPPSRIGGTGTARSGTTPPFKLCGDPRVTRVGALLRRSSLDELPQLWDVVRGKMSLVGPRPAIPYELDHYPPAWIRRFSVKPGITGLWQVSGRSNLTIAEMVELDLRYIDERSTWLNVRILLRTLPAVLSARGAA